MIAGMHRSRFPCETRNYLKRVNETWTTDHETQMCVLANVHAGFRPLLCERSGSAGEFDCKLQYSAAKTLHRDVMNAPRFPWCDPRQRHQALPNARLHGRNGHSSCVALACAPPPPSLGTIGSWRWLSRVLAMRFFHCAAHHARRRLTYRDLCSGCL